MKTIRLEYQVKLPLVDKYEVRELYHECDPNKSDKENLDDAFSKACELGGEPNKNIRWKFLPNIQGLADKFTNEVLKSVYGERFTSLTDVEEDEKINEEWDYLNEAFYGIMNRVCKID